ncbi:hypothetical protein ACIQVK_49730 [Streptomyces sp. NPDC090493]|uniref:hypothetical protein n=1 Tax=Streptomyces sp. NPDC090493 TaxID=3365964 RepID=UPI003825D5CC
MGFLRPSAASIALALQTLGGTLVNAGAAAFDVLGCTHPWEEQPSCTAAGADLGLWLLLGAFTLHVALLWFRCDCAPRRGVRVLMAWVVLVQIAAVRAMLDPVMQPVGAEWAELAAILAGCAYVTATAIRTALRPAPAPTV